MVVLASFGGNCSHSFNVRGLGCLMVLWPLEEERAANHIPRTFKMS